MKKRILKNVFGKNIYLLGKDKDGINYWLEAPEWSLDWYWGFGYVETYTNNRCPKRSRDIASHAHFRCNKNNEYPFIKDSILTDTTLNSKEERKLIYLIKSFYFFKNEAEQSFIVNKEKYIGMSTIILPTIMNKVIELLTPENEMPIKCKIPIII